MVCGILEVAQGLVPAHRLLDERHLVLVIGVEVGGKPGERGVRFPGLSAKVVAKLELLNFVEMLKCC